MKMKTKYLIVTIILTLVLGLFAATTEPTVESIESSDYVVEETIEIEKWMISPFHEWVEEPLELEEWMTKPFVIN